MFFINFYSNFLDDNGYDCFVNAFELQYVAYCFNVVKLNVNGS